MENTTAPQTTTKWADLTAQEEEDKLRSLGKILQEYGLSEHVQPISADHVVHILKTGFSSKQSRLMVIGKVPCSLAKNVKKFTAEAKEHVLAGINPYTTMVQIDVQPVSIGSQFSTVEGLVDLFKGTKSTLEHVSGQVILVNFWATWCRPSYAYMNQIVELQKVNSQTWGDKVKVVCISVDDSQEQAAAHANKEKWDSIEQLHLGASCVDLMFGTSRIPRAVLVNTEGEIVFLGHPKKIDLQHSINSIVNGAKLSLDTEILNEDDFTHIQPKSETEDLGQYSNSLDLTTVKDEMNRFTDQIIAHSQSDPLFIGSLKELLTEIVMTLRQSKYDVESDQMLTRYRLVNTLVGPEQAVSYVRGQLEAFLSSFGGSFSKEWEVTMISA